MTAMSLNMGATEAFGDWYLGEYILWAKHGGSQMISPSRGRASFYLLLQIDEWAYQAN